MPASAIQAHRDRAVIAGAVVLAGALSGCSATAPQDASTSTTTPTPEETAVAFAVTRAGVPITGTGAALQPGISFPVPEGDFRSLTLEVQCEGGAQYKIGIGEAMAPTQVQSGTCDGPTSFQWPLTSSIQESLTFVMFTEGVTWKITPLFSTAEFEADPAITVECDEYSTIYSSIFNADIGYAQYADIDETEWTRRIDAAADALDDLADASSTPLAEPFAEIVMILRSPQRVPGAMIMPTQSASSMVTEICGANQTQVSISADYGA
jgi:hypothetical protein